MNKKIFMILIRVLILVAISLCGCINRNESDQQDVVFSGFKNCAELNGYI